MEENAIIEISVGKLIDIAELMANLADTLLKQKKITIKILE